jgi:IS5 family transposase
MFSEKGIMTKNGTIVDTTIIHAPTSTKNESKQRDPEMKSTKNGNQWYFGMKCYVGVDAESGIVHTAICTHAKKARNRKLSGRRAIGEHPFHVIKNIFGYSKVRYRGIKKNALHLNIHCMLSSLYLKRRVLLAS